MSEVLKKWFNKYFSDEEAVYLAILLVTAVASIWFLGKILAPFIAAIVFAYILQGAIGRLTRIGMRPSAALWVVYLLFVALIVLLVFGVFPMVWQQGVSVISSAPKVIANIQDAIEAYAKIYPNWVSSDTLQQLYHSATQEVSAWGQQAWSFSLSSISNLFNVILFLILVPFLVFFYLKDKEQIGAFFFRFLPQKKKLLSVVWHEMDIQLSNYVRGKGIEIIIVGVVTYICFAFLGLKYAVLLSLLVGLSVIIPYVGAILVTIPVVFVAYIQFGIGDEFFVVLAFYVLIQALDGNLLVPILFSETVNLHPIAIIFSVMFFGYLWGVWGVFFAIPLATFVKAIMNAWPVMDAQLKSESSSG